MSPGTDQCLVILPTYNERGDIRTLLGALLDHKGIHVLVIDDASPDGTAEIVREIAAHRNNLHLIERDRKLGLGSAYARGFAWANGRDQFSAICTMDSDHSHDPSVIPALLAELENADLVIGSRYTTGGSIRNWSRTRMAVSWLANTIARCSVGGGIRDCTSGYRIYSADLLRKLGRKHYRSHGFSMLVELLHEAVREKARVAEHPIIFTDRSQGKSKMRLGEIVESLWIYGNLFRPRQPETVRDPVATKAK
jgi:glycosyltransferase involved in cell wall biosynthesis